MKKLKYICLNKPYVIGFYGTGGKSNLITSLIFALKKYKICAIKVSPFEHEALDAEKDSGKMRKSGALASIFISKKRWEVISEEGIDEMSGVKMVTLLFNPDAVFIEGSHAYDVPKVFIGGREKRENTIIEYNGNFESLLEYIKNEIEVHRVLSNLPMLDCKKCGYNCRKMAELIVIGEKTLNDCRQLYENMELYINDEFIPLTKFPRQILYGGISGMLNSLKDMNFSGDEKIKIYVEKY